MKRLTRLLLINWHYFQNEIIDFGDINFLTGKNSAGKSTIIDALQVVLMGETRSTAFNRAANKKSDRDLKSYLVGSMGEDVENGKTSIRDGKDFSTYIVAEFFDDFKSKFFCLGSVFDTFSDGGEIRKRFFYLRSCIPKCRFIENGKTMDSRRMLQYFKEKYPNKFDTKDTAESYKKIILSKLNIHDPKFMTMLKKAISFEPITDIEKFITENVCDIEDDIDITAMQENIMYYKKQEIMAQNFEKRLNKLEDICGLYSEIERFRARHKIQQFLIDYGTYMNYTGELEKTKNDLDEYNKKIAEFQQKYEDKKILINLLEAEHDKLIADKEKYWTDNNGELLESEQKRLKSEVEKLEKKLDKFKSSIKTCSVKWIEKLEKCSQAIKNEDSFTSLQSVVSYLKRTEKFTDNDFEHLSVKFFTEIRKVFLLTRKQLEPLSSTLDRELLELSGKSKELEKQIKALKNGIKQYPSKAENLKKYIREELRKKYNRDIAVSFLADLIEVTDEQWHNVVEGYLNTQRMNIIVHPQYFMDAYYIYKNISKAENIHEYAIVDLQKVYKSNRILKENSLAKKVKSEDKYVQAYIDFLLGNVICCYDENNLRDFRTSVTRECMLYHNYAVKSLNINAYNIPYIGRDSIKKQIETKELELTAINSKINEKNIESSVIKPVISDEWFLTENYILSTVEVVFSDFKEKIPLIQKLEETEDALSKIDLFWIEETKKKIQDKKAEIKAANEKSIEIRESIWDFERKIEDMRNKKIPELQKNISDCKKNIDEAYSADYQNQTGIVRYKNELAECKSPDKIVEKFSSTVKETVTSIKEKEKTLTEKRIEYNADERTSFRVTDVSNNDEYEKSYVQIKNYEIPKYREQIENAKNEAMEQFKSDFLYKLRGNIQTANEKINDLNRALELARFGNDTYEFKVVPNPNFRDYYDMIMSDSLENGNIGLFSIAFTDKYQTVIDSLFSQIISPNVDEGKTAKNVELFSKYKTYLKFSLRSKDRNGRTEDLSKTIFTKSGGEAQTPFYIAVLASFAQLYMVNDNSDRGNTARIVIFDEAFNKMDGERIIQSVQLLRKFGLQAIVCSPPEKAADIVPVSDKTLLVQKMSVGKIYQSTVIEWTKEMSETI